MDESLRRRVACTAIALAVVIMASCGGGTVSGDERSDGAPDPSSIKSTLPQASEKSDLLRLVTSIATDAARCCEANDEGGVAFEVGGATLVVTEATVDLTKDPFVDMRIGLEKRSIQSVDGGTVQLGVTKSGDNVVRFLCKQDGEVLEGVYRQFDLASPTADTSTLLKYASSLAKSADCSKMTLVGPTQCLGDLDDPAACTE